MLSCYFSCWLFLMMVSLPRVLYTLANSFCFAGCSYICKSLPMHVLPLLYTPLFMYFQSLSSNLDHAIPNTRCASAGNKTKWNPMLKCLFSFKSIYFTEPAAKSLGKTMTEFQALRKNPGEKIKSLYRSKKARVSLFMGGNSCVSPSPKLGESLSSLYQVLFFCRTSDL